MTKGARRLVTLPVAIDERAMKFVAKHGLTISSGLCMLIAEALDRAEGKDKPPPLCGCDHAVTCAAAFGREFNGRCRRNADGAGT